MVSAHPGRPGGEDTTSPPGPRRRWERSRRPVSPSGDLPRPGRLHLLHYATAPERPVDLAIPPNRDTHPSGPLPELAPGSVGAGPVPAGRSRARSLWIPAILLAADLTAFAAAVMLTSQLGFKILVLLVIVVALFQAGGLYRPRLSLSVLDDGPSIIGRSLAAGAAAMVLGGLQNGTAGTSRLLTCAVFGAAALLARALVYGGVRAARRRQRLRQRTPFLGAGTVAGSLAANLLAHGEYGLQPEGMLDDDPLLAESERPVPLLGGYGDLCQVILDRAVDVVIVTFGSLREPEIVPLLRTCDRLACEILFVPRLFEVHTVTRDTEVLWGTPLIRLRRAPFRTGAWTAKRLSDVVIAGTALILLAPILGLCALLAR